MFTLKEYFMDREREWPPSDEQTANAIKLINSIRQLESSSGFDLHLTSGYRPVDVNSFVAGAARFSTHCSCQGVDLADPNGKLSNFCMKNQDLLEELGLYMEDPRDAKHHVHLQIRAPKSGHRIFRA